MRPAWSAILPTAGPLSLAAFALGAVAWLVRCASLLRIVQKAQGFMGGFFNTREFFHGRPDRVVRAVRWTFFAEARHPQNLYYQSMA